MASPRNFSTVAGGGVVLHLVRRADLLQPAPVEHGHSVGELQRLVLVVGHEDRGLAGAVVDPAQPAAQVLADLGIERPEGLVEEEHAGLDRERAGERDALALAAGELRRVAVGEPRELDQVEEVADPAADLGPARPLRSLPGVEAVGDVVGHAHVLEQRVVLEHEAHGPLLHGQARGVVALEQDAAAIGEVETGDDAQERRLARARGAEQAEQLAGPHLEVEVVQHGGRVEGLRQALDPDRRGARRASAGLRPRGRRRSATRGAT